MLSQQDCKSTLGSWLTVACHPCWCAQSVLYNAEMLLLYTRSNLKWKWKKKKTTTDKKKRIISFSLLEISMVSIQLSIFLRRVDDVETKVGMTWDMRWKSPGQFYRVISSPSSVRVFTLVFLTDSSFFLLFFFCVFLNFVLFSQLIIYRESRTVRRQRVEYEFNSLASFRHPRLISSYKYLEHTRSRM